MAINVHCGSDDLVPQAFLTLLLRDCDSLVIIYKKHGHGLNEYHDSERGGSV